MKDNPVAKNAHKFNKASIMRDRKKDVKKGKVKHKGRDYAKEYADYHSRPDQIKRRAARNAARRALRGRKELTDEKDVHHKDNNPMNNDKSNLSIVTKHYNRREPRLRVEDLRKWFGKGKKGDWVRVGTDGEIKGDCAREPGEGKPKCMPRDKAHSMDKKDRASSARRKRRADPDADRPGTGNKPIMVKTDKKESVMHEDVNVKSIDKFKAAARDIGKNKDIDSQSIADALSTIVTAVRMLDKSTSGRTDVKYEKIISKESTRINNIVNKLNYGKGGATPEGKEIVKLLNKHGLNRPFRTIIFEGVEMNEASKVPAGMKFIASYIYKDANGNKHTHRHLRKGSKMTDPVVVYIDDKEWKVFQSFTKAKQAAINHIKGMKESVELDEKTNWKMGDGRPRNGARIQNDRFWNLPRTSLEYIRKDAHAAMKANPNGKKAGKYADEVNDAETVLAWRKKNGIRESVDLEEKNVPTNPALWAKMKAQAKAKFDVYPSAYANGWAAKKYKAAGGGWKTTTESKEMKTFWNIRESLDLVENYRTLARAGMGTESKGEARVGLELDYYDGAGTKRMGKITKVTPKGYMVKDEKDGKVRQFTFHDRTKAKEILARIGKGKYNESVELEYTEELSEMNTYTVVHVKKGKEIVKAKTSYEAAQKFAKMKRLKSTAGVDAHLMKESVELDEEFVVKYAKNKRGPIYQTKFKTQPEAEKFLAQKRKEGMNGIVSKAGKPVSMQKMADLQKESVELDEGLLQDLGNVYSAMKRKLMPNAKSSRQSFGQMQIDYLKNMMDNDEVFKDIVNNGITKSGSWKPGYKQKFDDFMKRNLKTRDATKLGFTGQQGAVRSFQKKIKQRHAMMNPKESCDDNTMNAQTKKDEKPPFVPNRKAGVKKDRFGNVVKDKNRAKYLAKLAMRGEKKST